MVEGKTEKCIIKCLKKSKPNTKYHAEWNGFEKSVKIFLPNKEWKKAEKLGFKVKWVFVFTKNNPAHVHYKK